MDFPLNDESGVLIEGFDLRADDPPALAPALLPAPLRGGRAREGDGPLHVGALRARPRKVLPILPSSPSRLATEHGVTDPARCPAATCAATSTTSPRSTTRPGRRTGASSPTRRRTSTPTRSTSSSSSARTGSWSPRRTARRSRSRSRVPDINQVLKRMNGRLLPLGWWHFLRTGRTIDRSGSASSE